MHYYLFLVTVPLVTQNEKLPLSKCAFIALVKSIEKITGVMSVLDLKCWCSQPCVISVGDNVALAESTYREITQIRAHMEPPGQI